MTIHNILKKEFSKDKLSKVNIHLLIKTYLEEKIKNNVTKETFSSFLKKSEFLSFFRTENFKNSPYKLDLDIIEDGSVRISDHDFSFEIENETENELLVTQNYWAGSNFNQLSIVYTKVINEIVIKKHFVFEWGLNNSIDCFLVIVSASKIYDMSRPREGGEEIIDYRYSFNKEYKEMDLITINNQDASLSELSKKAQKNNYLKEEDFEILKLKYDFDNKIETMMIDFFNPENFDNIDYFKETHDLLDFFVEKFEK